MQANYNKQRTPTTLDLPSAEKDKDAVCREFGVDRDYLRVLLLRAKDKFKDNWADLAPVWDNLLSQD